MGICHACETLSFVISVLFSLKKGLLLANFSVIHNFLLKLLLRILTNKVCLCVVAVVDFIIKILTKYLPCDYEPRALQCEQRSVAR